MNSSIGDSSSVQLYWDVLDHHAAVTHPRLSLFSIYTQSPRSVEELGFAQDL